MTTTWRRTLIGGNDSWQHAHVPRSPARAARRTGGNVVPAMEGSAMAVKPIPDGYHSVTPYLYVKDAARAIEFYKEAFGAKELLRLPGPGGKLMHAEVKI